MKKELWFKRKRYGYGYTPVTKQGWLVTCGFVCFLLLFTFMMQGWLETEQPLAIIVFITGLVVFILIFLFVIQNHAPKAEWRWGKDDRYNPEEDF